MVKREKPSEWAEIGVEGHVTLTVALWIVWAVVSVVMMVVFAFMSDPYGWPIDVLGCMMLMMYPVLTVWYLNQMRLRIGAVRRWRGGLRLSFHLVVWLVVVAWVIANIFVDDSRIDWASNDSHFSPPWYGLQFRRWGWPLDWLRIFTEPLPEAGGWSFDFWALAFDLIVLCFVLWWMAVAGFVACSVAGLEGWALTPDEHDNTAAADADAAQKKKPPIGSAASG